MSCDIINREHQMLQIAAAEYRLQRQVLQECRAALEALRFTRPHDTDFWGYDGIGGKALNHCRQLLHAHEHPLEYERHTTHQ